MQDIKNLIEELEAIIEFHNDWLRIVNKYM